MLVGNFRIRIVCANELEDGLYGDIYNNAQDCRKEHQTGNIIYGFYCERIIATSSHCEETPDWFYHLIDAVHWAETHE